MEFCFVFPGQGSQSLGMLNKLSDQFPCVLQTFSQASEALGYDLWQLVQQDEVRLNQTEVTQPAMLAADIAVLRCWQTQNSRMPVVVAGHSLGEYAALVAANSLDFAEAIKLVAKRGLFMQQAVPEGVGAMAAIIGLDDEKLFDVCDSAAQGEVVAPANFNSIGQTVIAGNQQAVRRALELAKSAGAKIAKLIPVSVPSHCELMRPAAEKMQAELKAVALNPPELAVLHNVDVATHFEPNAIRQALIDQMVAPVQWVRTMQKIINDYAVSHCYESGPGKVLAGLIKRIDRSLPVTSLITEVENEANE